MNSLKTFLIMSALVCVPPSAFAQSYKSSQGQAPEAGVSVSGTELDGEKLAAQRSVTIQDEQARQFRSAPPKLEASGFGVSSWSPDGKVERSEAPEGIAEAIKAMVPISPSVVQPDRSQKGDVGPDGVEPVSAIGDKQNKLIFGPDERVKVDNTARYPFSTFVYIATHFEDGNAIGCSGTVIGPHHVLTAANCVFDWKTNAWPKSIAIHPGRNGNDAPLGEYYAVGISIASGFSEAPKGTYDFNRMLYDIAVLRFDEKIGETTGWLVYGYDERLPVFVGNLIGYPADKDFTMWRTACEIDPGQGGENVLAHKCDVQGVGGAAIYQYSKNRDERTVYGVQVADSADANYAVRITAPWFEWILDIKSRK